MWLLSTDRAELHYFARSLDADGGYAILSHTWDGNEQSLQQVRAIQERCRTNRTNPREDPELSPKIRECCILAEKHGYRWVWIDSCCIDKTSSSELSEAINSMYKWYKSSEVCYAYLKDVPGGCNVHAKGSAFRKSRWHKRGWTLQELIAPDTVIFLSVDWRELGTRARLARLLQGITGIPFGILTGEDTPAECSASMRMFWASERKTTRIEDEAYCMMGLFGVSMPTNYGEGKRAFIRLQYEIMQHQECDMTLFAFGSVIDSDDIISHGMLFHGDSERIDRDNPWQYLLADSPRQFHHIFFYIPDIGSKAIQQYPPPQVGFCCFLCVFPSTNNFPWQDSASSPFNRVELPHFTETSYGVQCRLPVATVDGVTIAVILCESRGRHVGLFLTKDVRGKDPQRPRYFTGCDYTRSTAGSNARHLARMCDLGDDIDNLTFNKKPFHASWSTIYIVPSPSHFVFENAISPILRMNHNPDSRFQLPRWLVDRFIGLQFEVDELTHSDSLQVTSIIHRSGSHIYMCLGTCKEHRGFGKPPLWANLLTQTPPVVDPQVLSSHDCSRDHLGSESWAMRSRTFGDAEQTVRMSFTQSRRRLPEMAVLIHLELSGHGFQEMLQGSGISFPSLADHERAPRCLLPDTLIAPSSHALTLLLVKMLKGGLYAVRRIVNVNVSNFSSLVKLCKPLFNFEEDSAHTTALQAQQHLSSPQIETLGTDSPNAPSSMLLWFRRLLNDTKKDLLDLTAQQTPAGHNAPHIPITSLQSRPTSLQSGPDPVQRSSLRWVVTTVLCALFARILGLLPWKRRHRRHLAKPEVAAQCEPQCPGAW